MVWSTRYCESIKLLKQTVIDKDREREQTSDREEDGDVCIGDIR